MDEEDKCIKLRAGYSNEDTNHYIAVVFASDDGIEIVPASNIKADELLEE